MTTARDLVGLMAEPERRRVVAALILSSGDVAHIVAATGLEQRVVVTALERLVGGGLVEVGSDGTYVVLEETFKSAARSSSKVDTTARGPGEADPVDVVLARSFSEGRLVHLPRKRAKRLIVLDRLAQEFEPGRHYGEREVNRVLRAFQEDVATLRRYLVDEGFLDRADGSYWRSGGTVSITD